MASITFNPSTVELISSQQDFSLEVVYEGNAVGWTPGFTLPEDVTLLGSSSVHSSSLQTAFDYSFRVEENTSGEDRTLPIVFYVEENGERFLEPFQVHQEGASTVVGSIEVANSPVKIGATQNSHSFTVTYKNYLSGMYVIDSAGGGGGIDSPIPSASSQLVGDDMVVTYNAHFTNNLEPYSVTRRAFFQMHRPGTDGDEYVYGSGIINQEGVGTNVVLGNSPLEVAANSTRGTLIVTYSGALQSEDYDWEITEPTFSAGASLISSTSRDSGSDVYRTYTVGFPTNTSTSPVTYSAYFRMNYGQFHGENTASIRQAPSTPVDYAISCSWESITTGSSVSSLDITVRYEGGEYPEDVVGAATYTGNVTGVRSTVLEYNTGHNYVLMGYTITLNTTPGTSTVTFSLPPGNLTKTVTIVQTSGDPSIIVSGSPVTIPGNIEWANFKVTYKDSTGWTIDTCGTSKPDMQISSSSATAVGNDRVVEYLTTFQSNYTTESIERRLFFQMHSGSEYRYGSGIIYQTPYKATQGTIEVMPRYTWVGYSDTASTIRVTYNYAGKEYERLLPSPSEKVTVTRVGGSETTEGANLVFRATYPQNLTTSSITRYVTFRMTSGSTTVLDSAYIYQDRYGGGGSKQILVSPTSNWIAHDEISTTAQVTYQGFSSMEGISTPTCADTNWYAVAGHVDESSNRVVVSWIFRGVPNTGSNYKSTIFNIAATGAESKTFTVFQWGAGGGGSEVSESVDPIWRSKILFANTLNTRLKVTSGSKTIFDERVYASPDASQVFVDLSEICSPFVTVQPRPSYLYNRDQGFVLDTSWTPGERRTIFATTFPTFDAEFESGENYRVHYYNDRSYGLETAEQSGSLYLLHVGPKVQDRILPNQIVFFSVDNRDSGTARVQLKRGDATFVLSIREYMRHIWGLQMNVCTAPARNEFSIVPYQVTGSAAWTRVYKPLTGKIQGKYAVYYWNSLGGLDSLALCGPVVPSVEVTRNNYLQGVVNYTRSYLNGVVSRWRCNTGTLPDEYSVMVREMTTSPEVYLHDLEAGRIYLTRVTTNSVEEKTFRNQGRVFANYEFELEHILTRERR